MYRLYIIFMALLVKAAFSKIEGNGFHDISFFPFSKLTMIWPEYAWHITFYICVSALAWSFFFQEKKYHGAYVFEMGLFAVLMSGELADFMLRCSTVWFFIDWYPFGYDSFIFLVFGLATIRKQFLEWFSQMQNSSSV